MNRDKSHPPKKSQPVHHQREVDARKNKPSDLDSVVASMRESKQPEKDNANWNCDDVKYIEEKLPVR